MAKNIWVFCEQRDGELQNVSLELIGVARELAETTKEKVCAMLLGHNITGKASDLIAHGADEVYVVDDAELARVQASYPVMWKKKDATPKLCFVGCPHLSHAQLIEWTDKVVEGLKKNGLKKVSIPTVFTAAPAVCDAFNKTPYAAKLKETGVVLSYICPLMYMNNPLCKKMPVITNSNKLRTYTTSRYYTSDEILDIITKEAK